MRTDACKRQLASSPAHQSQKKRRNILESHRYSHIRIIIMTKNHTHNKPSAQNSNRTLYFDYMRVCATFAVIMIHVTAQYFYKVEPTSFAWKTINAYQCLSRWGVPVFVMMSGALFLPREIPLQKIYSKYVLNTSYAYSPASSSGLLCMRLRQKYFTIPGSFSTC